MKPTALGDSSGKRPREARKTRLPTVELRRESSSSKERSSGSGRLKQQALAGSGAGGEGGCASGEQGADSPSCAPLQEPALPYTSGPYLGHATATLLLLLPSVQ